ncbi:unnamed protein product [Rotaria sp. Silwood1]|nr:unnamed protein product [Rotaria sp. Silwood1]CAF1227965.1 unnamed protein product [Rotaria sp. Silwood1]CAF3470598.1 unnamed protein product [Rotaria sp. Silwood1]CAF3487070.1 unnamed protein product [Rotaria sp. Silwood1]CAF3490327.1 unnamed protein product [Rotaria sp. Silwood1]
MNATSSIDNTLSTTSYQLNIWFGSFLWIAGNLGCIGNMIVFCSQSFRKRAYSIYLFAAAVANLHYFNFVLLTRIIQNGFQFPIMNRFIIICKLRQFSTIWGNVVSYSLFAFAILDRVLSTQRSNRCRQWSNRVSLAYRMVIVIPVFWFLLLSHRIVLYSINNGICSPLKGFYAVYDTYFQVIFSSFCPVIAMSILAYFLMKNVRGVAQRRIQPTNNVSSIIIRNNSIINQMDSQLTIMLTLESLITIITYVPYAAQLIYVNITQEWYKTPLQLAWEKVFTELIHLFSYLFFATSFYVSIISNVGFRRKFKKILDMKRYNDSTNHTLTFHRT